MPKWRELKSHLKGLGGSVGLSIWLLVSAQVAISGLGD